MSRFVARDNQFFAESISRERIFHTKESRHSPILIPISSRDTRVFHDDANGTEVSVTYRTVRELSANSIPTWSSSRNSLAYLEILILRHDLPGGCPQRRTLREINPRMESGRWKETWEIAFGRFYETYLASCRLLKIGYLIRHTGERCPPSGREGGRQRAEKSDGEKRTKWNRLIGGEGKKKPRLPPGKDRQLGTNNQETRIKWKTFAPSPYASLLIFADVLRY